MRLPVTLTCALLITQCGAILNGNAEDERRAAICDTGVCKCTSWGHITVTCSCQNTSVQQSLELTGDFKPHANTNLFRVENCQRVHITSNTFRGLQNLRSIELSNIGQLVVDEYSFSWKLNESEARETYPQTGITVKIDNSTIPNIPSAAFQGRLESVVINKSRVGSVSTFAFTNLYGMETLQFIDTNFTNLEPQAFKKFFVEVMTLNGGNYGSFPSRTIVDLEIKTLVIENVAFDLLRSSSVIVAGPVMFKVTNCRFNRVEGDAFRVSARGPVHITNNLFVSLGGGAFAGITVERNTPQKLVFSGNNVTSFEAGALVFNTTRLIPELDRVLVGQACECNAIESWAVQLQTHARTSKPSDRKALDVLWCRWDEKGRASDRYISFHEYSATHCGVITSSMHVLLIIIIASSALLLLVGVVMIVVCRRRRGRSQRWINVSTTEQKGKSGKARRSDRRSDGRIDMVVPDGRTYRETELHVIVEQAEPIGEQHIYQNVKPMPRTSLREKPVPMPRTALT